MRFKKIADTSFQENKTSMLEAERKLTDNQFIIR